MSAPPVASPMAELVGEPEAEPVVEPIENGFEVITVLIFTFLIPCI